MVGTSLWRHALVGVIGLMIAARSASPASQTLASPAPDGATAAAALRAKGLDLGYNLDHEEALAAFRAAIAADPTHPAAYRLAAATMWIEALFRQGAVTADDYLGQARSDASRQPLSPELAASFQAHIDRALALGEQRLRAHPDDPDAHFQVGAAYAFLTTYKTTVEGRLLGGLRAARRAYNEHERVLELDTHRTDAALTVGMYRYGVSTLSVPLRLLAGLAGFGGGRLALPRRVRRQREHPMAGRSRRCRHRSRPASRGVAGVHRCLQPESPCR